ncbi:MAG: ATP-dependent zinc protease, partial [Deltaproteobacteria bacterium]|nr:ATP-dependent zinc protease [Deltaproteobacteria bacterium]
LGVQRRRIEVTLTNRDTMRFRMLLGRTAMEGMLVVPDKSYLLGRHANPYALKGKSR